MVKKIRAVLSVLIVMSMILGTCAMPLFVSAANITPQLYVSGNKLLNYNTDAEVRLVGVNIPGGEWTPTPTVERIARSAQWAIDNWGVNCIRLPIVYKYWMGVGTDNDGNPLSVYQAGYKQAIKEVINIASEAGIWVILDNHQFGYANQNTIDLWNDISKDTDIKNNPTVLFGIFNEPHNTTWDVWRNGNGGDAVGLQAVVNKIRDNAARNIIVAGGLDYAYDLRGVVSEAGDGINYALANKTTDNRDFGYGIVYDSHIYPWKGTASNFDSRVGTARRTYPVIIGEVGWAQPSIVMQGESDYQPSDPRYYTNWNPMLFDWMNDSATYGTKVSYTAYCMHTSSAPAMLVSPDANGVDFKNANYAYTTTEEWGTPAVNQIGIDMGLIEDPDTDTAEGWSVTNTFDTDLFGANAYENRWYDTTNGNDYIFGELNGTNGLAGGTAFKLTTRRAGGWWNVQCMDFDNADSSFDWSKAKYLSFVARGANPTGYARDNSISLAIRNASSTLYTASTVLNGDGWQYFSFPLTDGSGNFIDMSAVAQIQISGVKNNHQGVIYIDNFTISDYEIPAPELPTVTSITVSGAKSSYDTGEDFAYGTGTIEATFSDGLVTSYPLDAAIITGFDSSGPAESQTITVNFKGATTTYEITVSGEVAPWEIQNTWDGDLFPSNAYDNRWAGQTSADKMTKVGGPAMGIDGTNAVGFAYVRTGDWGGTQEVKNLPASWNWNKAKYLSFWTRIVPTDDKTSVNFGIKITGINKTVSFNATEEWTQVVYDLSTFDMSLAGYFQVTINNKAAGTMYIDNLTLSNYDPTGLFGPTEEPETDTDTSTEPEIPSDTDTETPSDSDLPEPTVGEVYSGDYSLMIINTGSENASDVKFLRHNVSVTPNTDYVVTFYATGVGGAGIRAMNPTTWAAIGEQATFDVDSSWAQKTYTFNSGDLSTVMLAFVTNPWNDAGDVFVDEVTLCESGSTENLLSDGGFENESSSWSSWGYPFFKVSADEESDSDLDTDVDYGTGWYVLNTWDADIFASNAYDLRWTNGTSINGSGASGVGLDGTNAYKLAFTGSGTYGVQCINPTTAASWDWSKGSYMSFWAKKDASITNDSTLKLSFGGISVSAPLTDEWQFFTFDISGMTNPADIQTSFASLGYSQIAYMDNLAISAEMPVLGGGGEESDTDTDTATEPDPESDTDIATEIIEPEVPDGGWQYLIDFDNINFSGADGWGGQNPQTDYFTDYGAVEGAGINGTKGREVFTSRLGGWGGNRRFSVPLGESSWDWTKTNYVSMWVRYEADPGYKASPAFFFTLDNVDASLFKMNFNPTTDWQLIVVDVSAVDLTGANQFRLTINETAVGTLYIDNFRASNFDPATGIIPEALLNSISVSGVTTTVGVGAPFDYKGTLTAHYSDGTTKTYNLNNPLVTVDYDFSQVGTAVVTIGLEDKTVTYNVTVEPISSDWSQINTFDNELFNASGAYDLRWGCSYSKNNTEGIDGSKALRIAYTADGAQRIKGVNTKMDWYKAEYISFWVKGADETSRTYRLLVVGATTQTYNFTVSGTNWQQIVIPLDGTNISDTTEIQWRGTAGTIYIDNFELSTFDPTITAAAITSVTPSLVQFSVKLAAEDAGAKIVVALYNGQELVGLKTVAVSDTQATFEAAEATHAKLFVWKSDTSARPLVENAFLATN